MTVRWEELLGGAFIGAGRGVLEQLGNIPGVPFQQLVQQQPMCCWHGHKCQECVDDWNKQQELRAEFERQAAEKASAYRERCRVYMVKFRAGYRNPGSQSP